MKIFLIGAVNLFDFAPGKKPAFWQAKNCPTQRAHLRYTSAGGIRRHALRAVKQFAQRGFEFSCSQAESTPAHLPCFANANRWALAYNFVNGG